MKALAGVVRLFVATSAGLLCSFMVNLGNWVQLTNGLSLAGKIMGGGKMDISAQRIGMIGASKHGTDDVGSEGLDLGGLKSKYYRSINSAVAGKKVSGGNDGGQTNDILKCRFVTGDAKQDSELPSFLIPAHDQPIYEMGVKDILAQIGGAAKEKRGGEGVGPIGNEDVSLAIQCEPVGVEASSVVDCKLCIYNEVSKDKKHFRQGQVLDAKLADCMGGGFRQGGKMNDSTYHPICYPPTEGTVNPRGGMVKGAGRSSGSKGSALKMDVGEDGEGFVPESLSWDDSVLASSMVMNVLEQQVAMSDLQEAEYAGPESYYGGGENYGMEPSYLFDGEGGNGNLEALEADLLQKGVSYVDENGQVYTGYLVGHDYFGDETNTSPYLITNEGVFTFQDPLAYPPFQEGQQPVAWNAAASNSLEGNTDWPALLRGEQEGQQTGGYDVGVSKPHEGFQQLQQPYQDGVGGPRQEQDLGYSYNWQI